MRKSLPIVIEVVDDVYCSDLCAFLKPVIRFGFEFTECLLFNENVPIEKSRFIPRRCPRCLKMTQSA